MPPTVKNPLCLAETVIYAPGTGQDIVVPPGFQVSVFASGLNMPTGIAFLGNKSHFTVYVLESGHGVPSRCNEQTKIGSGNFGPTNPLTPDALVFDQHRNKISGPLFKPTASGGGFQPAGRAVDIAFENGLAGGRLFATDSNQSTDTPGGNINSSRIVVLNPATGTGDAVHHQPADRRPSERAAGVQRRLDLLVAGLDDEQRRLRRRTAGYSRVRTSFSATTCSSRASVRR